MNEIIKNIITSPSFRWLQQIRDKSIGTILALHRVNQINPNGILFNEQLKVSPDHLEALIRMLRKDKFTFVSIDELVNEIKKKNPIKKLLVVTLDDGYRDNFENALPVFKIYSVPFTIYISTSFPEKQMIYWWFILEDIVLENEKLILNTGETYACRYKSEKEATFLAIRKKIIALNPFNFRETLPGLFSNYLFEVTKYNDTLPLSWEQIQTLSHEPLATLGGHTHAHIPLKYCSHDQIFEDINKSKILFENYLGQEPKHFCYPYGDSVSISSKEMDLVSKMGFKTAVTASFGNIYKKHVNSLFSLPRIFVTENQKPDLIKLLALMKLKDQ